MAHFAPLSAGAREALRTGRRTRVVRHARLAPARAEDAAHMRFALEDALGSADFGDLGRLLLVRRLRLLALPRLAGPGVVAQALEAAWRALAPRAVAHDDPGARHADAVYFASHFEARLAWLAARSAGQHTGAWFWRAAVPELAQSATPTGAGDARHAVIVALLQESARQTVRALRDWPDALALTLAAELPAATGALLLEAATTGSQPAGAAPAEEQHPGAAPLPDVVARVWPAALTRLLRHAPEHTPPLWLAATWMSAPPGDAPSRAQVAALLAHAATLARDGAAMPVSGPYVGQVARAAPSRVAKAAPASAATTAARDRAARVSADTAWSRNDSAEPAFANVASARLRMPSDLPSAVHTHVPTARQRFASGMPWLDNALPTSHGGLLLIVNVLHALRFEAWLDTLPPAERWTFANALPLHVLHQLQCAHDEPQLAWFDRTPVAMPWPLRMWTVRLRRFLRRHADMDLDALVRRPAWVSATATHADVIFALDQTDLRLRRRGLDRDPGWVPWLGRIASFHFLARERLPRQPDAPPRHG